MPSRTVSTPPEAYAQTVLFRILTTNLYRRRKNASQDRVVERYVHVRLGPDDPQRPGDRRGRTSLRGRRHGTLPVKRMFFIFACRSVTSHEERAFVRGIPGVHSQTTRIRSRYRQRLNSFRGTITPTLDATVLCFGIRRTSTEDVSPPLSGPPPSYGMRRLHSRRRCCHYLLGRRAALPPQGERSLSAPGDSEHFPFAFGSGRCLHRTKGRADPTRKTAPL